MPLILKNITKSFDNKLIFEKFSYEFSDSGIYAIVGDSGTGKTTLLRMIAGLDESYEGEISGGGIQNVSYAFQEHRLFPNLSAIENVIIPNGDSKDPSLYSEAADSLNTLGISTDDFSLLPHELSGGMRQRVALARAFLRKKPVLLLDEPTKELDENIRFSLYKMIEKESESRLVIIVSHQNDDLIHLNATEIQI